MRRSGVLNLRRWHFLEVLGKNRLLLLLCVLFLGGVIAGSTCLGNNERLSALAENGLRQIVSERSGAAFGAVLFNSFGSSMVYLTAVCVAGTSMLGIVISPVTVIWRGFYFGLLTALLYSEYALKGVAFNAIMLIPPAVFSVIGLILGAKDSVTFSLLLAKLTLPRSAPGSLFSEFRLYCIRFAILIITALLSALTDALVSHFFIGFFELQ